MRLELELRIDLPDTFRSNRVRSMYNVTPELAAVHRISADAPFESRDWRIGLVVGPSGTGKTSVGSRIGDLFRGAEWPADKPIIDSIGADASVDDAAGALSAVGLGTVPSWLRPYHVLSGGERFRADLARILMGPVGSAPLVYDEFTSVVDRTVAKIGAAAFAKAWRRRVDGARFVALSCHRDVTEWLCPDWVLDTEDWSFSWRSLRRPPPIEVDVFRTDRRAWPSFERHHYLKLNLPLGAFYVGTVGGEPVVHVAVRSTTTGGALLTRLVVMPEWQGAGIGLKFLDYIAEGWRSGELAFKGRGRWPIRIHTSHPGLIAGLSRRSGWTFAGSVIGKKRGAAGTRANRDLTAGHLRAVSSFQWIGK